MSKFVSLSYFDLAELFRLLYKGNALIETNQWGIS